MLCVVEIDANIATLWYNPIGTSHNAVATATGKRVKEKCTNAICKSLLCLSFYPSLGISANMTNHGFIIKTTYIFLKTYKNLFTEATKHNLLYVLYIVHWFHVKQLLTQDFQMTQSSERVFVVSCLMVEWQSTQ